MDEWKKVVIVVVAVLATIVVIFCAIVIAGKLINQQQPASIPDVQSEVEDVVVPDTGAGVFTERFLAAIEGCEYGEKEANALTGVVVCNDPPDYKQVEVEDEAVPPKEPEQKVKEEVEEPVAESGCPPARDLGPWAPNNGLGEVFEVTCNETNCAGTHIQLWWPAGSGQEWGTQEISVFLPPGLSIEVQDGAGRGWEYALSCSLEEIESQIVEDNVRRSNDTSYFGRVDIDDLIDTGLVVVRFDRR